MYPLLDAISELQERIEKVIMLQTMILKNLASVIPGLRLPVESHAR
jgi:hypothetical protein